MAAMFRKHHPRDLRVVARREKHEEPVVPHVHAGARGLRLSVEGDDLSRAGLSGDVPARQLGPSCSARLTVHNGPQSVTNRLHEFGFDLNRRLRRRGRDGNPPLSFINGPREVGRDQAAAIGHRRHHCRQRQRGHADGALSDGHGDRLSGVPPRLILAIAARPLRGGNQARLLVGQIDSGFANQAKLRGVLIDRVDGQLAADVVEEHVARPLDCDPHVNGAMSCVALEGATVPRRVARTVQACLRRNRALHEPGHRHDDLERGSWRIRALNEPVRHRLQTICCQRIPGRAIQACRERIRVVCRETCERDDFAGARIQEHPGAVKSRRLE
jgi:hypothetical protein